MSYNDRESSAYDGRPVTVYHFVHGGVSYYYTSSDENIDYNGNTALSIHIKHGTIKETTEDKRAGVKVEIDADAQLAKALRNNPVDSTCRINILRSHRNDADKEWVYYWRGVVSVVGREDRLKLNLECTHMLASLAVGGLRARYSYRCPHALYGASCRALRSGDKVKTFVVRALSGNRVSFTEWRSTDRTWWTGGQLTFKDGQYRRYIMSADLNGVTLDSFPSGLAVGSEVTLVAGCDRTKDTCQSKFNNLVNYGGYLNVPNKNPFQDGIV